MWYLFSVILASCGKIDATIGEKYPNSMTHLQFKDLGVDMNKVGELYLDFNEGNFELFHDDSLYNKGVVSPEMKNRLVSSLEKIKLSQVDKIYNVNSGDASLFQLSFWGVNPDFIYMIEIYGDRNAPKEVVDAITATRKAIKELYQSKPDMVWNESHALCIYWSQFAEEHYDPQAILFQVHCNNKIPDDISFRFYDSEVTGDTFNLETLSIRKQKEFYLLRLALSAKEFQMHLQGKELEHTCQESLLIDVINNGQLLEGFTTIKKTSDHIIKVGPQD